MASFVFAGVRYSANEGESVLECLLRHDVQVASSCRSGVCQACMVKATRGAIPAKAQQGLKATLRAQGCLLACVCPAEPDLELERTAALPVRRARVAEVEPLSGDVSRVWLSTEEPFSFEPGQFVQLVRPHDGLVRPYSIANLPGEGRLELHVAALPHGRMSQWLGSASGAELELRGPMGDCFYVPGREDQPLLLVGTGTGLAPLLGVARSALARGHRGAIRLYHGSVKVGGLYLYDELVRLARAHENLSFVASVLDPSDAAAEIRREPLERLLADELPALTGYRVFLCGNPELVRTLKRKTFMAGAAMQDIHSDPFVVAAHVP